MYDIMQTPKLKSKKLEQDVGYLSRISEIYYINDINLQVWIIILKNNVEFAST